jgi:hypothetical protein
MKKPLFNPDSPYWWFKDSGFRVIVKKIKEMDETQQRTLMEFDLRLQELERKLGVL